MRAGVSGVNVHVRTDAINAAFKLTRDGLAARPLLYGLIAFRRMLGTGPGTLVPVRQSARAAQHVKVWAVRDDGGLHVIAIDKGPRPATVDLRVPADGPATVARLTAPSATATSHVTLAGQWLDEAGRWRGRPRTQTISPVRGGYRVQVRRFSAALVTVKTSA